MGEIFILFPKLFVNKMIYKIDELPYQSSGSVIKRCKWNKVKQQMERMYAERETGKNILSYVCFSKICIVIKSLAKLKKDIGKEDITFPFSSSLKAI